MNIAVIDTNIRKFTRDMMEHWRAQGHEVNFRHTLHLPHIEQADVLWFDCLDNNLVQATRKYPALIRDKFVVVRAIDIDVWAGHFNNVDWLYVDELIFIADHVRAHFQSKASPPLHVGIHTIPCGVSVEKFTLRADPTGNRNIAVVMRLNHGKGLDLLLQAIAMLPEYTFHILGKWNLAGHESYWYRYYAKQFLDRYDNWTLTEHVDDVNAWLEDKTQAIVFSKKEAFSYAAAEALAKGIEVHIHHFYGADAIWPGKFLWWALDELVYRITSLEYNVARARRNRAAIMTLYPLDRMLESFDKILEGSKHATPN